MPGVLLGGIRNVSLFVLKLNCLLFPPVLLMSSMWQQAGGLSILTRGWREGEKQSEVRECRWWWGVFCAHTREHIPARTQDKAGGCMDIACLVIRKSPIRENHVLIITMFLLKIRSSHTCTQSRSGG